MVSMNKCLPCVDTYVKGAAPYAIGSSLISTAFALNRMGGIEIQGLDAITILALTHLGGIYALAREQSQKGRLNALKGASYSAAATTGILAVGHLARLAYNSPSDLITLGAIGTIEVGTRVIGALAFGAMFCIYDTQRDHFLNRQYDYLRMKIEDRIEPGIEQDFSTSQKSSVGDEL